MPFHCFGGKAEATLPFRPSFLSVGFYRVTRTSPVVRKLRRETPNIN